MEPDGVVTCMVGPLGVGWFDGWGCESGGCAVRCHGRVLQLPMAPFEQVAQRRDVRAGELAQHLVLDPFGLYPALGEGGLTGRGEPGEQDVLAVVAGAPFDQALTFEADDGFV